MAVLSFFVYSLPNLVYLEYIDPLDLLEYLDSLVPIDFLYIKNANRT